MMTIARAIGSRLGPPCIAANLESRPDGTPDCLVAAVTLSDNGTPISRTVPNCNTGKWCGNTTCTHADASADKPCWDLSSAIGCADGQTGLLVCRDPTCDPSIRPTNDENISVTCSLTP